MSLFPESHRRSKEIQTATIQRPEVGETGRARSEKWIVRVGTESRTEESGLQFDIRRR